MKVSKETQDVQAQVGVSIGLARSIVASWLPPVDKSASTKPDADTSNKDAPAVVHTRPRAGLGYGQDDTASRQHEQQSTGSQAADDLADRKLRRQLMYKNQKVEERRKAELSSKGKRTLHELDSDDEDEEFSRGKGSKSGKVTSKQSGTATKKHGLAAFDLYKSSKKTKR